MGEERVAGGVPREAALRRLMALHGEGRLRSEDVALAAAGMRVSERTMWRWVERAKATGEFGRLAHDRFEVTDALRERLAFWRGNAAAVYRELVEAERAGGPVAPSLATLRRAVARDVLPGDRAGLRGGEPARRAHDVFLARPKVHRNAVWEADHVQAPVEVDVEGRLVKPWVTWFVDVGTDAVCGTAVTAGPASSESILAALRSAIALEEPYGPPGGLPERVRIDRGKDFLSKTVSSVLAGFAVRVVALPAYTPHLKGTVEAVNGAADQMLFAGLPRYSDAQPLANGRPVDPDAPALRFEAFVAELLGWVRWWNTEHMMPALEGKTPLQAWLGDPTPLVTVPTGDLRLLTTKGISWSGRAYVGAWMTGQVGRAVRVRHMPHHTHEVEVFDADTAEHLGSATLADQATPEQIAELRKARATRAKALKADLRAAEKARRTRYAAATEAEPAQPVHGITSAQAAAELAATDVPPLRLVAEPASGTRARLIPLRPPAPGWVLPRPPAQATPAPIAADSEEDVDR